MATGARRSGQNGGLKKESRVVEAVRLLSGFYNAGLLRCALP